MPRTVREIIQCVPKPEACRMLGISDATFKRHWQTVFTDKRPASVRAMGKGSRRMVFADELAEACAAGGGVLRSATVAVRNYRRQIGRA